MPKSLFGRSGFRRDAAPVTPAIDFHPGHYWALGKQAAVNGNEMVGLNGWTGGSPTPETVTKFNWSNRTALDEFENTPLFRGLVARFTWSELENDAGTAYTWDLVDRYFRYCRTAQKRFILQFVIYADAPGEPLLPAYLLNPTYEGGEWEFVGNQIANGRRICYYNQALRNRMIALFNAIGARYNSEPYFEGMGGGETPLGTPDPSANMTAARITQYYEGIKQTINALKDAMPNKMAYNFCNFAEAGNRNQDYTRLTSLITAFRAATIAIGYPDTRMDDRALNTGLPGSPTPLDFGVYWNMRNNGRGVTPNICSVQPSNYEYTGNSAADPLGHLNPTIDEIYNDLLTNFPNYVFWTRQLPYNTPVVNYLNANLTPPYGGVITTPPTGYPTVLFS